MNKKNISPFLLSLCLFVGIYTEGGAQKPKLTPREEVKKRLEYMMWTQADLDSAHTPAVAIAVLDGDSTWIFTWGHIDREHSQSIDNQTLFEIGGVKRAFIAKRFMCWQKAGIVDENAPINTYLKPSQQCSAGKKITLLQLLTHTSGLPKLPPNFGEYSVRIEQPFADYTEGGLFEWLKSVDTLGLNARKYAFSFVGYAILGKIAENIAAQYPQNACPDILNDKKRTAQHTVVGYNLASQASPAWDFADAGFDASQGGFASITDLADFVRSEFDVQKKEGQTPFCKTYTNADMYAARAWHVKKARKTDICLATGNTGGCASFVGFCQKTHTGVIILSNSRINHTGLGWSILRSINRNWKRNH